MVTLETRPASVYATVAWYHVFFDRPIASGVMAVSAFCAHGPAARFSQPRTHAQASNESRGWPATPIPAATTNSPLATAIDAALALVLTLRVSSSSASRRSSFARDALAPIVSALTAAGAVLRASVAGIRALLIARADVKREFRIEQTMLRAAGNNPVKFAATDDQARQVVLAGMAHQRWRGRGCRGRGHGGAQFLCQLQHAQRLLCQRSQVLHFE